jgi:transcriptional regulator with XRE-family HTH domain
LVKGSDAVVAYEHSEIGHTLRRVRHARGKSLAVVAGLAGISTSYLSMLERGERAVDRRSLIIRLANALEIAPSDLTGLPVPAPANGGIDASMDAVRRALMAVQRGRSGGDMVPVEVLRSRIAQVSMDRVDCRHAEVGAALPGLIRDLHATLAAGRDVGALLDLAVLLHGQGTAAWLHGVHARVELRALATLTVRQAAEQRDDPTLLGLATYHDALMLLSSGDFALARDELDAVTVPTTSPETTQLAGMLMLTTSLVAAADNRAAEVDAALEHAADLAQHTGEGTAMWLGFGPTNVGLWRMAAALEAGDHDRTVAVAGGLDPRAHPFRSRQAAYWTDYGRALARIRGRHDDAIMAFRRAEKLFPARVLRNPFVRDVLAELLTRAKRDAVGRELRGLAYRAGLPV